MNPLDRRSTWPAIRNSLLIVAAIHLLILLRRSPGESFNLSDLLTRQPGLWLRWLAWSLVAPGIGLLARYLATRQLKWLQTTGLLVSGGVAALSVFYILEELLKVLVLGHPFFGSFDETVKNLLWSWDLPTFGLVLSTCLALEYYQNNRLKEVQAYRLEKELAASTLAALKAQVQPHFLFNTLHVISALVRRDPEAAERTIARLSDLLRASMTGDATAEAPLTAELDLLMNYVEIVQTRFKDRLRFELDVHPEAADARVPAFFLQPLVENAVRHGIAQSIEGGTVRVEVVRRRNTLVVQVSDTGPGFPDDRASCLRSGSGLSNLMKRLELLYPGEFRLELLGKAGTGARIVVEIPFQIDPADRR